MFHLQNQLHTRYHEHWVFPPLYPLSNFFQQHLFETDRWWHAISSAKQKIASCPHPYPRFTSHQCLHQNRPNPKAGYHTTRTHTNIKNCSLYNTSNITHCIRPKGETHPNPSTNSGQNWQYPMATRKYPCNKTEGLGTKPTTTQNPTYCAETPTPFQAHLQIPLYYNAWPSAQHTQNLLRRSSSPVSSPLLQSQYSLQHRFTVSITGSLPTEIYPPHCCPIYYTRFHKTRISHKVTTRTWYQPLGTRKHKWICTSPPQ